MVRILRYLAAVVFMGAAALTGCASTQIQTDWQDPAFRGAFRKVVVICLAKEPIVRSTLENDMAAQFASRGIATVQSTTLFASLRDVDRERVKRKVREIDADGVFLIRPVSQETTVFETYNDWSAYIGVPDQSLEAEVYRVQVSLFEAAQGKVVWQALSDTVISGAWTATLKEFARVMGAKLIERKLI